MSVVSVLAVSSGDQHKRLRRLWPSSVLPSSGCAKYCSSDTQMINLQVKKSKSNLSL